MKYESYEFDNRDSSQMYEYMEARIEALKRRIRELEAENAALHLRKLAESSDMTYIASA